jgi:hypothetical protein
VVLEYPAVAKFYGVRAEIAARGAETRRRNSAAKKTAKTPQT